MQISLRTPTTKYSLIASMALAVGLLAGCASTFKPATPEDIVGKRAQRRVELLTEKKYDQAYEYLAPSYRALNSTENYRGQFGNGARWIEPKVAQVECATEERCVVTVKLKVSVVARGFSKPIDSTLTETWLKEDGKWWYYQR
mgnify:CR=1 FL=1